MYGLFEMNDAATKTQVWILKVIKMIRKLQQARVGNLSWYLWWMIFSIFWNMKTSFAIEMLEDKEEPVMERLAVLIFSKTFNIKITSIWLLDVAFRFLNKGLV